MAQTALERLMNDKNLAPLILNLLDLEALAALTQTCGLLRNKTFKDYHYAKEQIIKRRLITYHLLRHPAYDNQFTEANLRPLLFLLKRNLKFAEKEFHKSSPNNSFRALYGQPAYIPFALAALTGRYEIIYYLVETNSHYPDKSDQAITKVIRKLKSKTGHTVSFYMIYGQHFKLLKSLVGKNMISRDEISDNAIRNDLLFAGGCAGVSNIDAILTDIYQVPVKLDLADQAIIASGLITAGHLRELSKYLTHQKLEITHVLSLHPTCLHHAARNGHRGMVSFVLEQIDQDNIRKLSNNENQFVLSQTDEYESTLLHYFAYHAWEAEFKRYASPTPSEPITPEPSLYNIKLSPTHKNKSNDTPLLHAFIGGHLRMAQFIETISAEDIKTLCQHEPSAIVLADTIISARRNDLILPLISEYQLPINLSYKHGMNILQLCAKYDNWEGFRILISSFDDPFRFKSSIKEEEMPITHVASSYGTVEFLRNLKAYCLAVGDQHYKNVFGQVDSQDNNMLHKACEKLFLSGYIHLLIEEFGLDLRNKNKDKNNPLHVALNRINDESRDVIWSELALIIQASEFPEELLHSTNRNNQSIHQLAVVDNKESLFAAYPQKKECLSGSIQ